MLRLKKNRNIIHTLRDRESNLSKNSHRMTLNIIRQLIESTNRQFVCNWEKKSPKPIIFQSDLLFFNLQKECYTIYGHEGLPSYLCSIKQFKARKKISDFVVYSSPIPTRPIMCNCSLQPCRCFSKHLFYVTEDNWLCQSDLENGSLIKEVFVNYNTSKFIRFKYCDWNLYGRTLVLTSIKFPIKIDKDIVVHVAVFTLFPLEFLTLTAIRRSVFGQNCKHANVTGHLLLIGLGLDQVHIYNFSEAINSGIVKSYKFGDELDGGRVGVWPTGIPLNCWIRERPPLLFNIRCQDQKLDFGATPFHCIYRNVSDLLFTAESLKNSSKSRRYHVESDLMSDDGDIVHFHPDSSNRILARQLQEVSCFRLDHRRGRLDLEFTMDFRDAPRRPPRDYSSRGRRLRRRADASAAPHQYEKCILAVDYEDELDLLGLLGYDPADSSASGVVKLFDSRTGRLVKSVPLRRALHDHHTYELALHLDVIVVIENTDQSFEAFVLNLCCDSPNQRRILDDEDDDHRT